VNMLATPKKRARFEWQSRVSEAKKCSKLLRPIPLFFVAVILVALFNYKAKAVEVPRDASVHIAKFERTPGAWVSMYDEDWSGDLKETLMKHGYWVLCYRDGMQDNTAHPEIYRRVTKEAPGVIRVKKFGTDEDVLKKYSGEKHLNVRTELRLEGFQFQLDTSYRATIEVMFDDPLYSAVFLQLYARNKLGKAAVIFQTQVKNESFSVRRWLTQDNEFRGPMEQVHLAPVKRNQWMKWEYEFHMTNKNNDGFIRLFVDDEPMYEYRGMTYWKNSNWTFWMQTGVYENLSTERDMSMLYRRIKLETLEKEDAGVDDDE